MTRDAIKLFSSVTPSLMRKTLFKGSFIAVCGVLIVTYFGLYLPPESLGLWGIPASAIGIGLIAFGLLPYRRLVRLEASPSEIVITDSNYLQYFSSGKQRYSIPMEMIQKSDYIEEKNSYGIALWFDVESTKKIIVHDRSFDMGKEQRISRKKYGCDLFIPNFGRRSFLRLAMLTP